MMRKRVLPRETDTKEEAILSSGALTYNCTVPRSAIPLKQLIYQVLQLILNLERNRTYIYGCTQVYQCASTGTPKKAIKGACFYNSM